MQSAAEREIARLAESLRYGLHGHDRAVLAGLVLCLVPIPPANAVGLLLTAFNLYLLASRRLPLREAWLLVVSVAALAAYALLWSSLVRFAFAHGVSIFRLPEFLHNWMQQLGPGDNGAIQAAWINKI